MGYMTIEEPFARPPERAESQATGGWAAVAAVATYEGLGELSWQRLDSATVMKRRGRLSGSAP